MVEMIENRELALADEFVRHTGAHVFLTGKAGTGKTTFLKRLREDCAKSMIVTAPTGVAAINAGGVTLHSFFQLPFGPFVPGGSNYQEMSRRMFRFSKEKKRIIRGLDLLVIDEISMVRADLLDAVDEVLRRHRGNDTPFGGVQLLMIGDLHQLSPVAKASEWELLAPHYPTVYFFSSRALGQTRWIPIELKTIYRQSDPAFIHILNQVRENALDPDTLDQLNRRCQPDFVPEKGYITLTTHNHGADAVNRRQLEALDGRPREFSASITGDFPDTVQPAPDRLCLKEGAQVMFLRNDTSPEKRYYNGKIGRILRFEPGEDRIWVDCQDQDAPIPVAPVEWENVQYKVNPDTQEIESQTLGKFSQYPLKPAWAVTIHKSQGMTFEKAVIDAGAAFAPGQVYVALSRCKSLEGMVLTVPIPPRGIETDPAVVELDRSTRDNFPTLEQLTAAKGEFQKRLILDCFDLGRLGGQLSYLFRTIRRNGNKIQVSGLEDMDGLEDKVHKDLVRVGEKFSAQLRGMFTPDGVSQEGLPQDDPRIQDRLSKAHGYFAKIFQGELAGLEKLFLETDNKELSKQLDRGLDNLRQTLVEKRAGILSLADGFDSETYVQTLSRARVGKVDRPKPKAPEYRESDISHPKLFEALKAWRLKTSKEKGLAAFQVLHQKTLVQIAVHLPDTQRTLAAIKGMGPKTCENYGESLLEIVGEYKKEHGVEDVELPPPPRESVESTPTVKAKKGDSRAASLSLFKEGKSPQEIAQVRNLALSTIRGHLLFYVEQGEVDLEGLVSPEHQKLIMAELEERPGPLGEMKKRLEPDIEYDTIRMVAARHRFLSSK